LQDRQHVAEVVMQGPGLGSRGLELVGQVDGRRRRSTGDQPRVTVLGRAVPVVETGQGVRATIDGQPMDPINVRRYLTRAFGRDLATVRAALEALAQAYPPDHLAAHAYALYEQFRPAVPEGTKGWGAKGDLRLDAIRTLAKKGHREAEATARVAARDRTGHSPG
jgi:hypothetical protein